MADNYLEKKMEEHRLRQAASHSKGSGLQRRRAGTLMVKFDSLRVFVCDGLGEYGDAIVRRMASAGCHVAFAGSDHKAGCRLAQNAGARFYPLGSEYGVGDALKDASAHWHGLDALFVGEVSAISLPASDIAALRRVVAVGRDVGLPDCTAREGLTVNAVSVSGITPDDAAQICLYLCLPSSSFIDRQCFRFA